MQSPFPESSSRAGDGRIVAALLPAGGSGLEAMTYQYPLKLISPSPVPGQQSVMVFILSYGGGLVGGDKVNLSIEVRAGARLCLVTQGHTKIFKSPSAAIVTSQTMEIRIGENGALCLLPDPVQPFANSVYTQSQVFRLAQGASLCLLDWVTQGRLARGEDWSFIGWSGRNEVWQSLDSEAQKERLLVRDVVKLSQENADSSGQSLHKTMHSMAVLGTLILRGPAMVSLGDFFLSEFAKLPRLGARDFRSLDAQKDEEMNQSELERWRSRRIGMEAEHGVLWSAARTRGCVIVKFGARTVEAGREWIGSVLIQEGTVGGCFGEQALMCVK
ncbi:UreD urease accessory protein-domain-containing protein [Stachybotrys elegans]|uniref:UreD urease accessory protein-domain-containing protein n=1 Tax=Stachybotrys elegans TaxID=80388 RepID=A0A8K0WQS9_9HYPO|nr:UreD urease accessory protein-domain-containing protein [Stachybotrys elegans]